MNLLYMCEFFQERFWYIIIIQYVLEYFSLTKDKKKLDFYTISKDIFPFFLKFVFFLDFCIFILMFPQIFIKYKNSALHSEGD